MWKSYRSITMWVLEIKLVNITYILEFTCYVIYVLQAFKKIQVKFWKP